MIKRLSDKKSVDDDSFLLINANEVLARDGIHGKIAEIGIGFGTGRHTSTRRATTTNTCLHAGNTDLLTCLKNM